MPFSQKRYEGKTMIDTCEVLSKLSKKRPIFHSEADFQHAFAWEIHQKLPNANVRLELPVHVKSEYLHIDIWVELQNQVIAFELKYKTRGISIETNRELYRLKNQSAQDLGRYDFIKDIERLEYISDEKMNFVGYAVLITNDSAYWIKPAKNDTVDAKFRLNEGRTLGDMLNWGEKASEGTKKKRERVLNLRNMYDVHWESYSHLSAAKYGEFRSLIIKVS